MPSRRVSDAARACAASPRKQKSPTRRNPKGSKKQNKLAAQWAAATNTTATGQGLWTAVSNGDLEAVQNLLNKDVDVNWADPYDGTTPAWLAAKDNNSEILQLLANAGADLFHTTTGTNQWSVAEVAAYYGSVAALKVLYNNGVDVFQDLNGNGQSPHEILWYRFNLSFEDLLDQDDTALGAMGAQLFQEALSLPRQISSSDDSPAE